MPEHLLAVCTILFLISTASVLIAMESNKRQKKLIDACRDENISASILDSFNDIKLDFSFGYLREKKKGSEVKIQELVVQLFLSDHIPKILAFKKEDIDKLWFLRIYSVCDDEVGYDVWYMDTEMETWYFEDTRKNPQIDRLATESETVILNNIISSMPEEKEKFLIAF